MLPVNLSLENRITALEQAIQISPGSNQIVLIAGGSKITITSNGIILETAGVVDIDARNIDLTASTNIDLTASTNIDLTAGMNTDLTSGTNLNLNCGSSAVINTRTDTMIKAGRNLNLSASNATL